MGSAVFSIIFCVLATVATVIAVGMAEVRADDQDANQARAQFKRDLAAAKVCQGEAFEWDGNAMTCFKEVRP